MRWTMLAGLLLLAACAQQGPSLRAQAAAKLVGLTEAELVQAAGVPTRAVDAAGRRFLVYEDRRFDILPDPLAGVWFRGMYYGGMFPPRVNEWVCVTTFEIKDGRAAAVTLQGNAC